MAKNRTSQQENLSSKTGIDVTSELGFIKPEKKAPIQDKPAKKAVVETVGKKAETKTAVVETSAKKSQKSKLMRPLDPEKVENTCKISAIISEDAKHNLEKYAKLYGYKKLSPFLNDLLERLDLYLD